MAHGHPKTAGNEAEAKKVSGWSLNVSDILCNRSGVSMELLNNVEQLIGHRNSITQALLIRSSICCFHGNHGFTAGKKGGWSGNGDARLINKGASCPIYTLLDVHTKG